MRTPAVADESLDQALRFEAAQAIPFPLDKLTWGGVVTLNEGEEMDLLISAAKLDAMEPLCAAAESAQLRPTRCEPASVAFWRALSQEIREPSLFVDVGARSTQVVIAGGDAPLYLRTLNLAGNTVTGLIAEMLHCDFAEAEAVKRRVLRAAEEAEGSREREGLQRKAVEHAATVFAQKLGSELLLTKLAYLRQSSGGQPARIFLCGGGSLLPGLAARLAEVLSLPVAELPPPSALAVAPELAESLPHAASDWYTLHGLALGATQAEAEQLNLLPLSRRAEYKARARRPWCLAAAALLVFLPLPLLIQQGSAIESLRAQAVALDAAAAPLLRLSASNAQAQAELAELRGQLEQVHALNTERVSWIDFFADLQARLTGVGDVWLERLHYKAPGGVPLRETGELGAAIIELGGWILEGPHTNEAIQRLFDSLQASDFVRGIERERYDRSRPGVIRFDADLVLAVEKPL